MQKKALLFSSKSAPSSRIYPFPFDSLSGQGIPEKTSFPLGFVSSSVVPLPYLGFSFPLKRKNFDQTAPLPALLRLLFSLSLLFSPCASPSLPSKNPVQSSSPAGANAPSSPCLRIFFSRSFFSQFIRCFWLTSSVASLGLTFLSSAIGED